MDPSQETSTAILGLYRDNGKEHGNYYSIIGNNMGFYIELMEKSMETTIV